MQSSRESAVGADEAASQEEHKGSVSLRTLEPTYLPPSEDMLVMVQSSKAVVEVADLSFKLDQDFRAGSYLIVCKDVTPGLPPRMQMPHTKILMKLVDLDPPPEEEN